MPIARARVAADATLPLTQIPVAELADRVLVVGDPARATQLAQQLDGAQRIASNREYLSFTGTHRGIPVSVVSHGIGGPGAAIAFEELCRAGVHRIIRAGTAGGLQPEIADGCLVVATAAVREDGVTHTLVPPEFPATADPALTLELDRAASAQNLPVHRGIVLTSGQFYPHNILDSSQARWQRAGCVAVEMEVAALLVTASLHGVQAAAILAIDGNPLAQQDVTMADYSPFREVVHTAVRGALQAALDALVS